MARRFGVSALLLAAGLAALLLLYSPVPLAGAYRVQLWQGAARLDRWLVHAPGTAPVPVPSRGGLPPSLVLGYYYGQPGSGAVTTLARYRHVLSGIVPFWFTIHRDGGITGRNDQQVVSYAKARHWWVFALVQNMRGASVFGPFLADPAAQASARRNLERLCRRYGYDGVNLDLEGIPAADRAAYTAFVRRLAAGLHRRGYYLTLSVPAETADAPQNAWSGAYDYRALGRWADLLMIMAYDQHSSDSAPGSIASRRWVERVVRYAVGVVPPAKIVLGVPAYGYDWTANGQSGAAALSYFQAAALARKYDRAHPHADHFAFYEDGVLHQVWYQNLNTFTRQVKVAVGYGLRGIVLWRLGIEDPTIWQVVRH
ncbi:MAG: glycosyl hydrolase family 18 protein [Thermaerobacter sp.]|nr:glycosyl hydrolase family 18 protein [Thermaerobacter sp.]